MRALFVLALGFALIFSACNNAGDGASEEQSADEVTAAESIDNSVVNNSISADEPVDTVNVAKLQFDNETFDFGTVMDGEVVTHTYKFTNVGKTPLVISNARSTCGCTVPKWPKEPIAPGEGGELTVEFKSKGKTRNGQESKQNKPVTITANTYPKNTVIYMKGTVIPDPNAPATETNATTTNTAANQ